MNPFTLGCMLTIAALAVSPEFDGSGDSEDGIDTLAYTMQSDSLWDAECVDTGDGCTYYYIEYPRFTGPGAPVIDSIEAYMQSWLEMKVDFERDSLDIQAVMADFIQNYRKYAETAEFTAYPWFAEQNIRLTANRAELVCLELGGFSYTGGAHGNAMVTYRIFNNPSGRAVHWESLLRQGARSFVRAIGERIFRKEALVGEGETLAEAGFWFEENRFRLSDNTGVTDTGLVFYYNTYEIASYAYGPTALVIPYDSLQELIPPGSPLNAVMEQ